MTNTKIKNQTALEKIQEAVNKYRLSRSTYESYSNEIARILGEIIRINEIRIQNIQNRAKSIDSFEKKSLKTYIDNESGDVKLYYENPLRDITDLSAIRIIVYTIKDVEKICNIVENNFEIFEKKDIGEDRFQSGRFGYQSIHYLCKLPANRRELPELAQYADIICEIQIRTVLQHAWAEMEHDIQYKSSQELPKSIQRKFLALAGLIEIADREFQSIQDEDLELKSSIQRSLQDDLTRDALSGGPVKTGKNVYANKGKSAQSSVKVRDLIEMGKFSEAIAIYDDLIDAEPAAHTLYLGRAKAKFLAGDRVGALDDIYRAEKFNSNDPNVSVVKSRMIEGDIKGSASGSNNESSRLARMGKEALDAGKGVEAFEYFSQAEDKGYNKAFSLMNKSVACILSSDVRGARYFVSQLNEIPGTPMQINVVAVNAIIGAIEGVENSQLVDRLRAIVIDKPEYSLELSPINSIYINIEQFPKTHKEKMKLIFDIFIRDKEQ